MIRGLFCGVSEYRANQQLPYCINDAKKMKEVFMENLVCSDDSIVVLAKDGRIENSEYIRELVRFSENCVEEDIAVVYYSGHGGIDERGDNYLYATNTFDGNDMTCVYFDVIIEHLKKSKAKSKLVIIDCCHADSNYGSEKQKFDTDKAIKDIYQSGITAVFSCRKDQESHPYYDNEISAFTQFFCDAVGYKKSYQPEGLYLSDLKITLDAYARVWNIKNESMQQVPVLRSNMIGTVVFPLKYPPKISERKKRGFVFDNFDALDFQWQVKKPKEIEHYQKVYRAEVVAKVDIDDENIVAFLQNVINKLKAIKIRPETQKQWITQEQPVDVVQIWIAKDYLDVSDIKNFAYQAYWENDDILYWCKQLGTSRVQIENMAYRKNTDYDRQRKDREKYVLPDDLIKEFWKTNLKKLIVETESVIYAYSNFYVNKELSYEDLRKKARDVYSKLYDVYRSVVEEWFPLTDSELKDYSKQSYDLAIDIQELLFLLNSDKGEEWAISNFKLKLIKYYRSMEAWKEATDKLE